MGQKVHPIGMRVGIIRDWDAKWYAEKEYADYLHEDLAIRKFVQKELADAAISTIEIERAVNKVNVSLHTAKPGMVIDKGGANVDALRAKRTPTRLPYRLRRSNPCRLRSSAFPVPPNPRAAVAHTD